MPSATSSRDAAMSRLQLPEGLEADGVSAAALGYIPESGDLQLLCCVISSSADGSGDCREL